MLRFILLFTLFIFLPNLHFLSAQETVQVQVDFGSQNSPSEGFWNNLFLPRTGSLNQISDSRGFITPFRLEIVDRFNSINQSGTTQPDPALGIPASASGDSFYGNNSLCSK